MPSRAHQNKAKAKARAAQQQQQQQQQADQLEAIQVAQALAVSEKEAAEKADADAQALDRLTDEVALTADVINRHARGLKNLGNTCFFNAALQCLASLVPLWRYFSPSRSKAGEAAMCIAFRSFLHDMHTPGGTVAPGDLFTAVAKRAPRFRSHAQQDAQEGLRVLLDGVSDEEDARLKAVLARKRAAAASEEEAAAIIAPPNVINQVFGGKLCSVVVCSVCGTASLSHEPFTDVSLQLPTAAMQVEESAPPAHGKGGGAGSGGGGKNKKGRDDKVSIQDLDKELGGKGHQLQSTTSSSSRQATKAASAAASRATAQTQKQTTPVKSKQQQELEALTKELGVSGGKPLTVLDQAWLKTASKIELIDWLQQHAPKSVLLQHKLNDAAKAKQVKLNSTQLQALVTQVHTNRMKVVQELAAAHKAKSENASANSTAGTTAIQSNGETPAEAAASTGQQVDGGPLDTSAVAEQPPAQELQSDAEARTAIQQTGTGNAAEVDATPPSTGESAEPVVSSHTATATAAAEPVAAVDEAAASAAVAEPATENGVPSTAEALQPTEATPPVPPALAACATAEADAPESAPAAETAAAVSGHAPDAESLPASTGESTTEGTMDVTMVHGVRLPPPLPVRISGKPSLEACLAAFCSVERLTVSSGNGYSCFECAAAQAAATKQASAHANGHVSTEDAAVDGTSSAEEEVGGAAPSAAAASAKEAAKERGDKPPSAALRPVLRDASKRMLLQSPLPPILQLHLKRFRVSPKGALSKVNGHVSLPPLLDMTPYVAVQADAAATSGPMLYNLVGVVVHSGGLSGGHYVAYLRDHTGAWFYANDSSVTPSSLAAALAAEAYVVFYERIDEPPSEASPVPVADAAPAATQAPASTDVAPPQQLVEGSA